MPDVFLCADTHFSHHNIIDYCNRPFVNVDEMDEFLIQNWNGVVKQGDILYFLGDFAFKDADKALKIRKRLNGNIYFIQGNHDQAAWKIKDTFGWFKQVAMIKVGEQEIFLSHYAHRVWNKSHHGVWHGFAHSHSSLPDDPHNLSCDVGVDAVAQRLADKRPSVEIDGMRVSGLKCREDYRPMAFEELKAIMDAKGWKPIDHHGDENEDEDKYMHEIQIKWAQKYTQEKHRPGQEDCGATNH